MTIPSGQMTDEAVARLLRATRANDTAAAPTRHSQQTPQCPHAARFAAVMKFGDKWTAEENAHLATGCAFCAKVTEMFAKALTAAAQTETVQDETVTNLGGADDTVTGKPRPKPKKNAPPGDTKPKT
jgi:hypothetical protein